MVTYNVGAYQVLTPISFEGSHAMVVGGGARLVTVPGVCRLSSSVTLHGGPAVGFTRAGQVMTSFRHIRLTQFQISFRSVHFRRSYSRTRDGRSFAPYIILIIGYSSI